MSAHPGVSDHPPRSLITILTALIHPMGYELAGHPREVKTEGFRRVNERVPIQG